MLKWSNHQLLDSRWKFIGTYRSYGKDARYQKNFGMRGLPAIPVG